MLKTLKDIENLEYKYNPLHLPEESGVYFFVKDNTLLYIGQSENIKKRVCNNDQLIRLYSPKICYQLTADEKTRKGLERYYISKFLPIFNRAISNDGDYSLTIYYIDTEEQYNKISLDEIYDILRPLNKNYFGYKIERCV